MSDRRAGSTGRRHRSRTEADQLAAEYEASGLTRPEFCLQKNIPMKTLGRYIARRRRENAAQRGAQRWVAVEVAGAGGQSDQITVSLAGGRRIEIRPGFDADMLRKLVSVLERV